jgi:hypothetical protein
MYGATTFNMKEERCTHVKIDTRLEFDCECAIIITIIMNEQWIYKIQREINKCLETQKWKHNI